MTLTARLNWTAAYLEAKGRHHSEAQSGKNRINIAALKGNPESFYNTIILLFKSMVSLSLSFVAHILLSEIRKKNEYNLKYDEDNYFENFAYEFIPCSG